MGRETRLFKSEERMNRSNVAAFLQQLADKIGEGQVVLRQGQQEITLDLPQNLILEIQVEDEDKKTPGFFLSSRSARCTACPRLEARGTAD